MRTLSLALALFVLGIAAASAADLDQMEAVPSGWTGPQFAPSFDFPASAPPAEVLPWQAIDFRSEPARYLQAVLAYVLEGQSLASWRVQDNPVRRWYHMPWMGPGGSGREFINGLTRERDARIGSLGEGQKVCRQNWAVGFYNPAGGHALGRIWGPVRDGSGPPNLSALPFPAGTVVAKLLVTEANPDEVPLLAGGPIFQVNIHEKTVEGPNCAPATTGSPPVPAGRKPATLTLLQLDVAIRDPRLDNTTGWIFGTFVYDGRMPGSDPWKKIAPVGLMWGNDPGLSDSDAEAGKRPTESIVLSMFGFPRPGGFGRGHRMNGPVDNPVSACMSCHMTSQWPNPASLTPPGGANWDTVKCWFRNLSPSTPFGFAPSPNRECGAMPSGVVSLDYSLQLAVALRNWTALQQPMLMGLTTPAAPDAVPFLVDGIESLPIHR